MQNRNQHVAALFLYLVQVTNLDVIEHKFLESGHIFMEVDSMHSAIGSAKMYVRTCIHYSGLAKYIQISKIEEDKK